LLLQILNPGYQTAVSVAGLFPAPIHIVEPSDIQVKIKKSWRVVYQLTVGSYQISGMHQAKPDSLSQFS